MADGARRKDEIKLAVSDSKLDQESAELCQLVRNDPYGWASFLSRLRGQEKGTPDLDLLIRVARFGAETITGRTLGRKV